MLVEVGGDPARRLTVPFAPSAAPGLESRHGSVDPLPMPADARESEGEPDVDLA